MCITITVGERGRRVMGLLTTTINVALVFCSLILFTLAIAIRFKLDEKLELLDGYNSGALPYYLMVIAGIMFFCHLVAISFCYNATYVETRSEKHHTFVTLIIVVIVVFILIVISEIVLAVHSSKIRSSLNDGIYKSMKSYRTDLGNKYKIDKLQMEYQCCGAEGHNEWFEIPWVSVMYVNTDHNEVKPHIKDGEFIKDDVPFSCCNKFIKRACVHHSVRSSNAHNRYDSHTLYRDGCVDVMMAYFSSGLLTPTGLLLLVILILQGIDVAVMRLLQTSIFEAEEMNDPEGASEAYCIKGVGGGGDNRRYLKRKKNKKSKKESGSDDSEKENKEESGGDEAGGSGDNDDDDASSPGKSRKADRFKSDGVGGKGSGGKKSKDTSSPDGNEEDDGGSDGDGGGSKKSKKDKKTGKEDNKDEEKSKKEEKLDKKKEKEEKKKKKKEEKEEKRKKNWKRNKQRKRKRREEKEKGREEKGKGREEK